MTRDTPSPQHRPAVSQMTERRAACSRRTIRRLQYCSYVQERKTAYQHLLTSFP